jgi:hypothetical protein
MAFHHLIAAGFADGVHFGHPASPWQRGSNANTVSVRVNGTLDLQLGSGRGAASGLIGQAGAGS